MKIYKIQRMNDGKYKSKFWNDFTHKEGRTFTTLSGVKNSLRYYYTYHYHGTDLYENCCLVTIEILFDKKSTASLQIGKVLVKKERIVRTDKNYRPYELIPIYE